MNDELRTDFTREECETVIHHLRDEYGNQKFSKELILLECQDLWRKGCHNLENGIECHGCGPNGECGLIDWEKRHPEYNDDALAKRLKELRDEVAGIRREEVTKSLLAKGYVKVQWKQWNDGELIKSDIKLYSPGSKDLKADIAEAIENWSNMWDAENIKLNAINLNAKKGIILSLTVRDHDEYELWEIV